MLKLWNCGKRGRGEEGKRGRREEGKKGRREFDRTESSLPRMELQSLEVGGFSCHCEAVGCCA
jgi:hypothetical protein